MDKDFVADRAAIDSIAEQNKALSPKYPKPTYENMRLLQNMYFLFTSIRDKVNPNGLLESMKDDVVIHVPLKVGCIKEMNSMIKEYKDQL